MKSALFGMIYVEFEFQESHFCGTFGFSLAANISRVGGANVKNMEHGAKTHRLHRDRRAERKSASMRNDLE
jgi:hypothetical protein